MIPENFQGRAQPRTEIRIPELAFRIGVDEDTIRAVLEVEASGRGFDRQGRPAMLFEPHLFYRLTSGNERARAVEQGLAYRSWGEQPYPNDSYPRMARAMAINRQAALQSASWGASQVLGQNHAMLGYPDAEAMVANFCDNEDAHIEGMVRFILGAGLDRHLRNRDWTAFAAGYNGPGFRKNNYHTRLAQAYARWARVPDLQWSPDMADPADLGLTREQVAQVQTALASLGYPEVGRSDGIWGPRTRAAVLAFRSDHGLPIYAGVDDDMWAALARSTGRPRVGNRAAATVEDLREAGSETVAEADRIGLVGKASGVVAAIAAVREIAQLAQESETYAAELMKLLTDLFAPLANIPGIETLLPLGLAVFLWAERNKLIQIRLRDHQTGKNTGR